MKELICGDKILDLSTPKIMGILNIGQESFYDGGKYITQNIALQKAIQMVEQGASILDIGAQSSKPKASLMNLDDELNLLNKIVPNIIDYFKHTNIIISIDTYKPQVMHYMLNQGVHMINDIYGFTNKLSQDIAAQYNCGVCIMHMQNTPSDMQDNPQYTNIVEEIKLFLLQQAKILNSKGINNNRIAIDVGFGFGKNFAHNIELLKNLHIFSDLGYAHLVGLSRKSFIGTITQKTVENRLAGTLAANLLCLQKQANILRVHDVDEACDIIKMYQALC